MKRIWHHPEDTDGGKHYWRSANELQDTPELREWMEREFPQGSAELAGGEEAEVAKKLAAFRKQRSQDRARLKMAQDKLREALTPTQEATLVAYGVLD